MIRTKTAVSVISASISMDAKPSRKAENFMPALPALDCPKGAWREKNQTSGLFQLCCLYPRFHRRDLPCQQQGRSPIDRVLLRQRYCGCAFIGIYVFIHT